MIMIKSIYTLSIKNKRKEIIPAAVITQKKTVNYFEARRIKRKKNPSLPHHMKIKKKQEPIKTMTSKSGANFSFF